VSCSGLSSSYTKAPSLLSLAFEISFHAAHINMYLICTSFPLFWTDDEFPFTYTEGTGKGPMKWGQIDPHWKVCGNGKMQSPIDLLDKRVQVFPSLGKLKRGYKPAPAVVMNRGHDIAVSCCFSLYFVILLCSRVFIIMSVNSDNVCNFNPMNA
jgi:hypothetical protein